MVSELHTGFTLTGDITPDGNWFGDSDAGIFIDKTNKKVEIWVNGIKVHEWS